MLIEIFVYLASLAAPPELAAHIAVRAQGLPTAAAVELVRVCHRESRGPGVGACGSVGVHKLDAGHSRKVWGNAARVGWIDPACQPYGPGGWSTRGAFGLMAAYHVRLLWPCAPAWVLDVPMLSAWVAASKLKTLCETPPGRRHPASVRWGRCKWRRQPTGVAPVWREDLEALAIP